ncbi:glyoxalase superfamily protein [Pseudodonghicola flavimaris]|uniref:Glyoxalase superfamily protein n=1 Tax=Pseudodonghicola flavimaris TaxID=3050036 RepID=A0ABT7F5L5_9RHOB|nr:glyoxalase superfamily protein [Pseudodonghicola flavimaris]MDK3019899.1 glyoxalase superfamily protein [Pseudodonghicola flavimaris]
MSGSEDTAKITAYKAQAKSLRALLAAQGTPISHSQALELVAHQQGARDWNTLRALAARPDRGNARPLAVGDRVVGRYLGQPFAGIVHGLSGGTHGGPRRITLQFDDPVDVVTFDSFSSFRRRVTATIDETGQSPQKTSNGVPQLIVMAEGM